MDVSVIILNFNTFNLTSACIRSVYRHTTNITFEVILVDNGSSECSPCRFKAEFPDIVLVESKTNLGFSRGNNLGLKYATGNFFLLLNSDTELLNNAIKLAYDRLQQAPEAACVAGKLFYQNGQVQHNIQRFPSISFLLVEILRLFHFLSPEKRGQYLLGGYFSYQKETYADWVWATFFLMRRNLLTEFPGEKLHEDFFMYEEDKQWCYFLRQQGYKILFSPAPHILHHTGGSRKTNNQKTNLNYTILYNEYRFMRMTRGLFYTKLYFLLKSVQYITSRYQHSNLMARQYFKIAVKGPATV